MKQLTASFPLFFGLVFIVCAVTACKTSSEAEMSTVVALAGHARYRNGDSGKWRDIRTGSLIPQGSVIQTEEGTTNAVKLSLCRRLQFLPSFDHPDFNDVNHLTLYGNSVLKLEHVTAKTASGKRISDIRLILSKGYVGCNIGYLGPQDVFPPPRVRGEKLETIKPQPDKSYFEIRSSNIVVHAEHAGSLFFNPSHGAALLSGVAAREFIDTGVIKDLFAYQRCDFVTGEITDFEIKEPSAPTLTAQPDFKFLRMEPPEISPRFSVPQRPF